MTPPFSGFLMSLNHTPEINCTDKAVGVVLVGIRPVRYGCSRAQVIGRSASQDNDLKNASFLAEQVPKPFHAVAITLHQLIVEHYRGLQVLCQSKAIQGRQLFPRTN